jgi:uncharacterized glyoxalase superfamily protein PhnB
MVVGPAGRGRGSSGGATAGRIPRNTPAWNCATAAEVDAAFALALKAGAKSFKAPEKTFYGGYRGYFADPDGHVWEVVTAPGIEVLPDGSVRLPD